MSYLRSNAQDVRSVRVEHGVRVLRDGPGVRHDQGEYSNTAILVIHIYKISFGAAVSAG
jgi:hypothetical protein